MEFARCIDCNFWTICGSNRVHQLGEALSKMNNHLRNLNQRAVYFEQTQQHGQEASKVAAIHESTTPYHPQHIADIAATQPKGVPIPTSLPSEYLSALATAIYLARVHRVDSNRFASRKPLIMIEAIAARHPNGHWGREAEHDRLLFFPI
jgi:hypothetical protein